jgi:intracellular sulfur oxidation DsrE/DsrF family protein
MSKPSEERRSFLTSLNARVVALAAMAAGGVAIAQGKSKTPARWEPARHEKDDWLDALPGKHRLIFDTTTAEGFGEALAFAGNFMRVNQSEYGLHDGDLAVIIVARHSSTMLGYNDAIWAKYGAAQTRVKNPKTNQAPTVNIYRSSLESLFERGVQLAVCSSATHAIVDRLAPAVGGSAEAIYAEFIANLMPNSRLVPAGIVAVNRAQERGYSLVRA